MIKHRLLLLAAFSLATLAGQAAEKEFLLSGTRWRLEDVSAEVGVQFQGIRTNRATGGWNVAVKLVNNGTGDLYTPLVLSIDSYTGTTGPTDADGYDEDFPPRPFYNLSALQPDGVLLPGNATLSRTLSLGPGSLPQLTTRVFAWIPPPGFRITEISFGPDGKPLIEHTAETNSYYILLAGDQVTNVTLAADMALPSGTNGLGQLRDFISASSNAARFFRVRKVPLNQPLDSDNDGMDDVWELSHAAPPESENPLDPTDASRIGTSGRTLLEEYLAAKLPLTSIVESSPANGESGVAVTRETIFRFNFPLASSTLLTTNDLCACFGGRQILSRIELSTDRKKVTLFYQEPLPASARVRVTFNGTNLVDYLGRALDLDGDNQPGGNAIVDFDTLSITPVAGTAVIGHIYASVQVPVVSTNSTTNFVDHPLPGVLISVIGAEEKLFTTTDEQGFFILTNCPAGRFFVSIDGHSSTNDFPNSDPNWTKRAYYPLVGKPWEAVAGRTNNLAGGTGLIYLPLVQAGTLQPVSPTADTTIGFPPEVIAANPAWAGVSVTIPTNALYSDNGTRGGRVGLAPVPADRLPERLPAGIVHVLDISIQTDGPQNVDRPLPVRFPNLPDPQTGLKLPPGTKSALMSYNHDTGRWEVQGPMTVTADGNYVETDPGVGVRQPGWHGTMQGSQGTGGPIFPPCDEPPTCLANSSLSGGTAKASRVNLCAGGTIRFEATGVSPHPGTLEACDGTISATSGAPLEYKWEITRDGTQFGTGNGSAATVASAQAGNYSCTFTVVLNDECPSPPKVLISPTVSVAGSGPDPNDIDCDGIPNDSDPDKDGDGIPNDDDDDDDDSEPKVYRIKYATFIPNNSLRAPLEHPSSYCEILIDPLTPPVTKILYFKGDNRGADSSYAASSRGVQILSVVPEEAGSEALASPQGFVHGSYRHRNDETRSYSSDALADGLINSADDDGQTSDCYLLHQTGYAGTGTFYFNVHRLGPHRVEIKLSGSPADPLLAGSPHIDWDITITLDSSNPNGTHYLIQGTHDGFPDHEVFVNDNLLYYFHGTDINSLWGTSDTPFSASGILP